jgi:hypothetical protein
MHNDDEKHSDEPGKTDVNKKDVPPPAKKVGDETPNPLPDEDSLPGGDPGRTS